MSSFKLALIQMDCEFLNVDANLEKAEKKVREAKANGANIVCLPEAFNTGYYCLNYPAMCELAEPLDGKSITTMRKLARELDIYIVAPILFLVRPGIIENTAVLIDGAGEVLGTYSKTHLVGDERFYIERGTHYPVFHTKFGPVGILICYDICFPETATILANRGAGIIICPAAWRGGSYYKEWLDIDAAARALDNTLFVALLNRVGALPNSPFCGGTQVVGPTGKVLEQCSSDEEEILYQVIDLNEVIKTREDNTVLFDRHPEDYWPLTNR